MPTTRPAAIAGSFYPGDAATLSHNVSQLLGQAAVRQVAPSQMPKVLIAPHAGHVYSGATAAAAYVQWAAARDTIRRVVLLGPVHRVAVQGLALPGVDQFATPLGTVAVDAAAVQALSALPQVCVSAAAHAQEHSLEVHLPFLQTLLADFTLVPLAVGNASPEAIAQVLDLLWGGPETVILISSDLSHFHPYAQAQAMDGATVAALLSLQDLHSHEQACGAIPINGALRAARQRGLRPRLVAQCNSGDTAGDKNRVVGYASLALDAALPEGETEADATLGQNLLALARGTIAAKLGFGATTVRNQPALHQQGASFVTLTQNGQLRGCIGSLQAHRTLLVDVQANAWAAAQQDPRFPPLQPQELIHTRVEVSLLTPAEPMVFSDENDALAQMQPGVDGIILIAGTHRSTFLPQVWEQLPEPRVFLAHLKQKARLAADFWSADVQLLRYRVKKWKEAERPRSRQ